MKALTIRLAKDDILKSKRLYLPFILSATGIIALAYIVNSLANNESLLETYAGSYVSMFLMMGTFIIYFFAIVFFFYTNSFISKKRRSQLGLYNILGLSKIDLVKVVFFETAIVFLIALIFGTALGILLEKLAFLLILRFIDVEVIFGFTINFKVITANAIWFFGIFLALFIYSAITVIRNDPIRLLRSKEVAEKEPKAKWLITLIGIIFMGFGYYLANATSGAMESLAFFFPAVFCVIIGTYLLFTSGSIALLKFLKSRKNYYYKTRHFITISHLIFRMKKNAAGLASICIMATMILVMTASTTSMWFSMESTIERLFPRDMLIEIQGLDESEDERVIKIIDDSLSKIDNSALDMSVFDSGEIYGTIVDDTLEVHDSIYNSSQVFTIIKASDYTYLTDDQLDLGANEIALSTESYTYDHSYLSIKGEDYKIKEVYRGNIAALPDTNSVNQNGEIVIIMNDADVSKITDMWRNYYFDFKDRLDISNDRFQMFDDLKEAYSDYAVSISNKGEFDQILRGMYASFLFLGIFLGLTFMLSIVLIMYYKQISEGDEDKGRYEIMSKVGLSDKEIRRTIDSQVIFVFFMPLVVAIIHLLGSYKMVNSLLVALSQLPTDTYRYTMIISLVAFIIFYVVVYILTSRTYYKIVTKKA